jgi:hypothetical protein
MIPEWIKEVWPAIACIFAGIVTFLTFAQQLLTIIKLRLEIRDLTGKHSIGRKDRQPRAVGRRDDQTLTRPRDHRPSVAVGPALKVALLSFLVTGSAIGYVWQKEQISTMAAMTAAKQEHLALLRKYNELMSFVITNAVSQTEATATNKQQQAIKNKADKK